MLPSEICASMMLTRRTGELIMDVQGFERLDPCDQITGISQKVGDDAWKVTVIVAALGNGVLARLFRVLPFRCRSLPTA